MARVIRRWKKPFRKGKPFRTLLEYLKYLKDYYRYSKMEGAESIKFFDSYPCLFDSTSKIKIDSHYFYQHIWAFKKILKLKPVFNVDIGSNVDFVGLLSTITKVDFVDIRPLQVSNVQNLKSIKGSILDLPYNDNSLESITCLHVAEHIGLGRYGDSLDPLGTKKAAVEISRCLGKAGNLFLSLPVGMPCTCFNAHRIHSPLQILDYFSSLKLIEFSGTDDNKNFVENISCRQLEKARYACGMFHFIKE